MSSISLSSLPIALQTAGAGSQWISLLMYAAIFAIFYFILIRPQQRQRKQHELTIQNLKKGDRVVTTGGLYGEIAAVDGATVILKVADNVKLKVAKSAIAGLEGDGDKGVKP